MRYFKSFMLVVIRLFKICKIITYLLCVRFSCSTCIMEEAAVGITDVDTHKKEKLDADMTTCSVYLGDVMLKVSDMNNHFYRCFYTGVFTELGSF